MFGVAKIIFIGTFLALLVIGFEASFTFLSYAMDKLPMGTAYEYGRELVRQVEHHLK
ncbi:SMR family transporter [Peribacillus sp. NPDC101481]|uniref:SMR family transporter n=1 Tax=Peribacillus sp. NPDC101481 TaxID=3364403 RepID=UPI0038119CFF